MKASLRRVDDHGTKYNALMFVCPGCEAMGGSGLHMLPVNAEGLGKPSWHFDGNLESPTLSPSILTRYGDVGVCHSFLRGGVFEFLNDCTHPLAGQKVPIPDLHDWAAEMVDRTS